MAIEPRSKRSLAAPAITGDGRAIASISFGVGENERFVYRWRIMLDQTEPGGEVRTHYVARNKDGMYCQSLHAVLRAIWVIKVGQTKAGPYELSF